MTSSPASARLHRALNGIAEPTKTPTSGRSGSTETLIRRAKAFLFVFDQGEVVPEEVAVHTGVSKVVAKRDLLNLLGFKLVEQGEAGADKVIPYGLPDRLAKGDRHDASALFGAIYGTGAIALAETSAVERDTVPPVKTKAATTAKTPKDSKMATVKTKAKTTAKPKTTGAAKPKTGPVAKKAAEAEGGASARRTQEAVDALVPDFLSHVQEGGTLRALKAEHGFSDDGPIRAAMFRAGYNSKGVELTEDEAAPIASKGAALSKRLVKEREAGVPWYALAHRTGLKEAEVKAIVKEAGGPTGRVYREPKPKAPKAKTAAGKAKAKSAATKAKEDAADPS